MGLKRLRRLYCKVGIGFHMEVLPDGKIAGVHEEGRYSKQIWLPLLFQSLLSSHYVQ